MTCWLVRERWAEAGLVTRDEMDTNCCYARQDKTWVHDPDGYEWEVFVVLEDNLAETSMCCVTGDVKVNNDAQPATAGGTCATVQVKASDDATSGSCGCATAAPSQEQAPVSCCSDTTAPVALSR